MAVLARLDDEDDNLELEEAAEMASLPTSDEVDAETGADAQAEAEPRWLDMANQSFEASDRYVKASLASDWERNLRLWQSRHPSGSKYRSPEYAARSKIFRPKTRSAMRKREAAAANAFFATQDVVVVEAHDDGDPLQLAAARVAKELVNYRLQKTLPWFLTAIGAYQDSNIFGFCVSRQGWLFEEREEGAPQLVPQLDEFGMPKLKDGMPVLASVPNMKVLTDRPDITLFPPENIRIDFGASWIDQAQSSPYLIALHPMYVCDIKARMKAKDSKTGAPAWTEFNETEIRSARDEMHDSVRKARYQDKQDPVSDNERSLQEFDIVYVREVFMRHGGDDWTFWTLGSRQMLTKPRKTSEVFWYLGRRPYRIGVSQIETHQAVPTGVVGLGADLQQLANQIVNDRNDNVRLALQARYFVRAGRNVDLESLRKNIPGASTMMQDPEKDVVVERAPDVTSSAYVEQDRANVDYDELIGHFSAGTVQSERNLNETVGGMNMLHNSVNSVQDFDLRVWSESWVEPVLRDLLKMEQALEDDEAVLRIAGKKAQLFQEFRIRELTDEILSKEVHLTVNVGLGATDPMQRLQKFQMAAQTVGMALGPQIQQMLNGPEIIDEVFGILGYKNARRFFKLDQGEDPQVSQLKQQVQQLQQELENNLAAARLDHEAKMAKITADTSKTAAELRAEFAQASAELQQRQTEDSNKTLVSILQLLQNQQKIAVDAQAGQQERALQARDQNIGIDADRGKRMSEAAKKADDERKAKEKTDAEDKKRAAEGARFEKLLTTLMTENQKVITGALAEFSKVASRPRKAVRDPQTNKLIGVE